MIAIIDYDAGNIKSVEKALRLLGQEVSVTRDAGAILDADKVILPGVGAFGDAMEKLVNYGLDEVIREVARRDTPFLGICLGLQLLFERSEESPGVKGLGVLKGEIVRIPENAGLKVPHMGWDYITIKKPDSPLFEDLQDNPRYYFVHSYYAACDREKDVLAETEYGIRIHSIIGHGNIVGVQFHPEKSHKYGMRILHNFLEKV